MTRTMWAMMGMAAALSLPAQKPEAPESLLQAAIKKEVVDGNLGAAIEGYKKALAAAKENRAVAAKAIYQLGECYRKQGNAQARQMFERLVKEYGDQPVAAEARRRLAVMQGSNVEGGLVQRRLWTTNGLIYAGKPSADGRYLVFYDAVRVNLQRRDLITGETKVIVPHVEGEQPWGAVISPDGRLVAYTARLRVAGAMKFLCELRLAGSDGTGARTILKQPACPYVIGWSPGQDKLLLRLEESGSRTTVLATLSFPDLVLKRFREVEVQPVYPVADASAGYSPDGRFIVVQVPKGRSQSGVLIASSDGSGLTELTSGPWSDWKPIWAPDGNRIVFLSNRSGTIDLWAVRVRNGRVEGAPEIVKADVKMDPRGFGADGSLYYAETLTRSDVWVAELDERGGVMSAPVRFNKRSIGSSRGPVAWSPDGDRLAFSHRSASKLRIVIGPLAGGEERELPGEYFSVLGWMPDGRSLVAAQGPSLLHRVDVESGTVQESIRYSGEKASLSGDGSVLLY